MTDHQLDGWRDAATQLLQATPHGVPLVPLEVLRALYRRGGDDRALAEELHEATGGQVA